MIWSLRDRRCSKRRFLLLLLLLWCVIVTICFIKLRRYLYSDFIIMRFEHSNDISCHFIQELDALPSAESSKFTPKAHSIFFHETSCSGGLNSRQACAVESAARAHPKRQVYVLFSGPISYYVLERSVLAKLQLYPNTRFVRVHIKEYAKGTPLEEFVHSNILNSSGWPVPHTSDILSYLTLYKYGGIYLDTDVVVLKSFRPFGHNWIAKQDLDNVGTGVIAISTNGLGKKVMVDILNEIKNNYNPNSWSDLGPGTIKKILMKFCPAIKKGWSTEKCKGFYIFGPELFYPLHYTWSFKYFMAGNMNAIETGFKPHMHHMWNFGNWKVPVEKDSPYARLAKVYCPLVYEMYGEQFGI